MVVTVASWIGLTVSAQRDGSPNKSCSGCAWAAEYRRRCGSMRIWQRSAMACTRTPERSVMVSENVSVGVAAYRSAVAPVQPKMRSAMSAFFQLGLARSGHQVRAASLTLQQHRAPPQPVQEDGQGRVGLRAAVASLPFHPQLADPPAALLDRDQEDFIPRGGLAGACARHSTA